MKNKKIKLELLAPAKDAAIGKAAILAGADAVYIGGPDFGARAAAGNSWDDIGDLIVFAHQYYARVYVVLNTIFFDKEKKLVQEFIDRAYKINADALIIQDLGVLEMELPPIPLFASTQMHNYDIDRIKFLAAAGLERIILARELSLEEIKKIKIELKDSADLEVFIHGALCVSFSGQCHFSQYLSGRSANRGRCMQACRLPYDLVDADGKVLSKNKYLLSLKDLNQSKNIAALVKAGVTSFKIEGRLKDKSYVVNNVAAYRKILDDLIKSNNCYVKASSGKEEIGFTPDLEKGFNRGFTEYFLYGRGAEVISPLSQKSIGRFVGKVKTIGREFFILDCDSDLENGDGVCWFDKKRLTGVNINKAEGRKIYPARPVNLHIGDEIYCNQDLSFEKETERIDRKVAIDFYIYENEDGFTLRAVDEDDNEIKKRFLAEIRLAENFNTNNVWQSQMGRLGGTIFYLRDIVLNWDKPRFVPNSVLNGWRREIISLLLEKRLKSYFLKRAEHKKTNHAYPVKDLDYSYNIANSLAKNFYENHGSEVKEMAVEKTLDCNDIKLMTTKHCLKYWLGACPKNKISFNKNKENLFREPLYLVCAGKKFRLSFDCGRCEMSIWND
jgi:putative protease